jgi:hypothetical protein
VFFVSYLNLPTCDVSTHFVICNEYREGRRMERGGGARAGNYFSLSKRDPVCPIKITAFYFGVPKVRGRVWEILAHSDSSSVTTLLMG